MLTTAMWPELCRMNSGRFPVIRSRTVMSGNSPPCCCWLKPVASSQPGAGSGPGLLALPLAAALSAAMPASSRA